MLSTTIVKQAKRIK